MPQELKRKKSLLIVRNLVVAEILFYGLFMLLALSADWSQLYQMHFPISGYVPFTILEFVGLGLSQIALIAIVVMRSFFEEQDIKEILNSNEHERLEFKTTLRWDVNRDRVNKELEQGVMKTITAFLNSAGGTLVIGVDDHRQVYGLEADMMSLAKQNHDGFENHFNNLFGSMIGPELRQYVKLSFHYVDGKSVSLIQVDPAHRPAYLKTEKGEDFFIRTGNATTPLKVSQVDPYISSQWRR